MRFVYALLIFAIAAILVALAGWIGFYLGRMEGWITTGSPAYFMLDDIAKRLQHNDPKIQADIQAVLEEMDPKNNSGVNGPAMIRYMHRRPAEH